MYDHPIHQLLRMSCVVHHQDPGVVDEYGDHPLNVVTDTTERCHIQMSSRGETDEIERERWSIYFLPSTIIDANDALTVTGLELVVDGNPWRVVDPVTGNETHIEATAIRRQ